ncbi:phosphohistidine phosphatase [Rubricella aquisinus]|uniref:Phosphohistidine phosphatase n=1 Tax=Rubricella aquisinus TaxID=2028108 RepID=A0A840WPU6_9RHOB|nr:histidine phosphatase family protein [Rubricella aquisinus]MBB5517068.1 phosphohistidine phosphatase [Rubricella aquisinus]
MKRIVLIRHAKSSWSDPDIADVDRPLNQRGRLCAPLMAAWLREHNLIPDHIWISPAKRSMETWAAMKPLFAEVPEPQTEKALYMADPKTALAVIGTTPTAAETLFLIGHQPGIGSLARKLSTSKVGESQRRAFTKYPTAGTAIFECDAGEWAEVEFGKNHFKHFAAPKDLV